MKQLMELNAVDLIIEEQRILNNISLMINEGECVTLSGPSGSGKSTILKLMASLLSQSNGQIIYQGQDIATLEPTTYRREVSYCFQQPALFGETVYDNLAFPFILREVAIDEEKMLTLLADVHLPETYLHKSIHELSGGEKQRVALIRNLLFRPQMLLLDEVTTGLDEESKQIVHQLLAKQQALGTTLVQVTHDQEELKLAQRMIQIVQGSVVSDEFISSK